MDKQNSKKCGQERIKFCRQAVFIVVNSRATFSHLHALTSVTLKQVIVFVVTLFDSRIRNLFLFDGFPQISFLSFTSQINLCSDFRLKLAMHFKTIKNDIYYSLNSLPSGIRNCKHLSSVIP